MALTIICSLPTSTTKLGVAVRPAVELTVKVVAELLNAALKAEAQVLPKVVSLKSMVGVVWFTPERSVNVNLKPPMMSEAALPSGTSEGVVVEKLISCTQGPPTVRATVGYLFWAA